MKVFGWIVIIIICLGLVSVVSIASGWILSAVSVVQKEVAPENLLRKYEWFKDASAQLDKKRADIGIYTERLKPFDGIARNDMDRADKEQLSLWQSELAGITSSYNGLAAEYNSQMAKINWRFCNVGDLPKGVSEPLPRKYAEYNYGKAF